MESQTSTVRETLVAKLLAGQCFYYMINTNRPPMSLSIPVENEKLDGWVMFCTDGDGFLTIYYDHSSKARRVLDYCLKFPDFELVRVW